MPMQYRLDLTFFIRHTTYITCTKNVQYLISNTNCTAHHISTMVSYYFDHNFPSPYEGCLGCLHSKYPQPFNPSIRA